MATVKEFLDLIKSKVEIHAGYVWAAQGEILTRELFDKFVSIHGRSRYYLTNTSAEKWIGRQVFDCSGLIVWTLQQLGILNKSQDYTASGLYYYLCDFIIKDELKPGDLVFSGNNGITHVGVYAGNNKVYHARGTFYGVVETNLLSSFNKFGRLKCLKEEYKVAEHWAEKYWKFLNENGVIVHDKRFDDKITRAEVMTLLARIKGIKED